MMTRRRPVLVGRQSDSIRKHQSCDQGSGGLYTLREVDVRVNTLTVDSRLVSAPVGGVTTSANTEQKPRPCAQLGCLAIISF